MNSRVRSFAADWLVARRPAIVVEVVSARGSIPRGPGTRMLVAADAIVGTIGGGHLELVATTTARTMLSRGDLAERQQRHALGPSLGQCCGGSVTLSYAPLDTASLARWPATEPLFRLQLHGAGHVGRAVATLLATLDCEVDWFDQRDDGFPDLTTLGSPWPTHIRRTSVDTVEGEVAGAVPGTCFLVLTHEHALDLRIVEAVLRRGEFAWLGLIGSRTKRASFASRLAARGHSASEIDRIVCPVGARGIAGKEPEVIAVSAVVQLLAVTSTQRAVAE